MKKEQILTQELEQLYVKEGIILERKDPFSNSTFYVPNLKKIKIMLREFNFLVEGASRGKAINEISKIEIYLNSHEDDPELQKIHLATMYSRTSIYLESKSDMITDMQSENWDNILIQYFSMEQIYNYFYKVEGAYNYFKKFGIFNEMIELNYNIKLMVYLQDQIEIYNPSRSGKVIPFKIDSLELSLLIFEKLGILSTLKEEMKLDYYNNASKLFTTLLGKPSSSWNKIYEILWYMDHNKEESILSDSSLSSQLKELLFHYKIDLR